MAAHYDSYDYEAYWDHRQYEHLSETYALKSFLNEIPEVGKALEIGAGFGRLIPSYAYRAKKVWVTDPSASILKIAKKKLAAFPNLEFSQSSLENLPLKFKSHSFDLIVMVRVLHHITDVPHALTVIKRLLKKNGYLILEYANKRHLKATLEETSKGNLEYLINPEPVDIRSHKSIKAKTIPFFNYHPSFIKEHLQKAGFSVIDKLSVSNIRIPWLKKYIPLETLLALEKISQKPFSTVDWGPSIFILAKNDR